MTRAGTGADGAIGIDERTDFIGLGGEDRALLKALWPAVSERLETLLDEVYRDIRHQRSIAGLIEGQTGRLKAAQAEHWRHLFAARFDDDYLRRVEAVGLAHVRIGLTPRWYLGTYTKILRRLVPIALAAEEAGGTATDRVNAVVSAALLDAEIAISTYQHTLLEERRRTQERLDAAVKEAAGATETVSRNIQTVASAAEELSAAIMEINGQVAKSTEICEEAVTRSTEAATTIASLEEAATQIGTVVTLIRDIAAQTNLLALNATIEAARAGEAGRGFSVVASEVKSLAGQTARATDDITKRIETLRTMSENSAGAVTGIGDVISRINAIATTIASAIEEQDAATRQISENIQGVAAGATQVADTIAAVAAAEAA